MLGAVLIGALAWMAVSLPSATGTGSRLDLAYLPPDAELIISCRLADIWNAPILGPLVNSPRVRERIDAMHERIGLGPADVSSVVIAVTDLSELKAKGQQHAGAPQLSGAVVPAGVLDSSSGVMVIRTSKACDRQTLMAYAQQSENAVGEIEEATHAGETYYRAATLRGSDLRKAAVFFPNDKTIVIIPA
jgi:hypothetical protein